MTRQLFALLVLAALGLGSAVGLHPCATSHREPESPRPACHEMAAPPEDPELRAGRPLAGSPDCCDVVCEYACHSPAVAEGGPTHLAAVPLSLAPAETPARMLPQFVPPIDHVPLA